MSRILITGTGLFTPPDSVTNAELVESLSNAVAAWNTAHAVEIEREEVDQRDPPSEAFIRKASGVGHRYMMDKKGVLDPERLRPRLPTRSEEELSIQAEICVAAIEEALEQAGRRGSDVDAILLGASNIQRAYPAVAIEVQHAIGAGGFAYDMNVACSSATFSLQAAVDALRAGSARCVVVVNPEITSGHNNFELREFHFIFGDACTAMVLERAEDARTGESWEVLGSKLATQYSNNIRNDFGFLNASEVDPRQPHELVFRQNGRRVYQEVCPLVAQLITAQLDELGVPVDDIRRFWLHQANLGMNQLIAKIILGRTPEPGEAPVILDEYANTSSAGSVIAFHKHRADLKEGDHAILCSFGAGYSIGSAVLRKFAS